MKSTLSILAIFIVVLTVGCKKDKKESKADIITSGNWKFKTIEIMPGFDYDGDGTTDTEIYHLFDACEKDNYFVFRKDGKMEINEGPTKCSPTDPQIETNDWELLNNETTISIDGDEAQIQELTNSKFSFKYGDVGSSMIVTLIR